VSRTSSIKRPTRTLTVCAPASESVEHGDGKYHNQPWSIAGVTAAISAGMWFEPTSRHNFAPGARKIALDHFYRLPRDQFGRIVR
jgi:hypothetical protein